MPVPVLKQGDVLIASIQAALSDADLLQLRDELAEKVGRLRARGVIVDVTALDVMDSFATRTLRGIVQTDRKSTRLNSSHLVISYAVFCLKKKKKTNKLPMIPVQLDQHRVHSKSSHSSKLQ